MVEVLDVFYEVDCSMVTIKEGDVDIGANASAEEQTESLEDGAMTVGRSTCHLLERSRDRTVN